MRYFVTSNQRNTLHQETILANSENIPDIYMVIEFLKAYWINTPEYIHYLTDMGIEGEDICIIDFETRETVFLNSKPITTVNIKIY